MKIIVSVIFVFAVFSFLGCNKPRGTNEVEKILSGTYELRSVSGMGGLKTHSAGNDTLLIFCNGRYQEKIKGVIKEEGSFKIEKKSAKEINYCKINELQSGIKDYDLYLLMGEGNKSLGVLASNDLPGMLKLYRGCSYNDTGYDYAYERISGCP